MDTLVLVVCLITGVLLATPTTAQQYKIQYVGHYAGVGESVIKATKSGLILGVDARLCPFLYNENTKALTRLCDKGLTVATDVNESGKVVGSARSHRRTVPAYWSKSEGLKHIPLFADTTDGVAQGVNKHGEIVGYQYKEQQVPNPYYRDYNRNRVCDDLPSTDPIYEGKCTAVMNVTRSFVYSKANGLVSAFNISNARMSVALDINDSGSIVGYIGRGEPVVSANFTLALQKRNGASAFIGAPVTARNRQRKWVYLDTDSSIDFGSAQINNKNVVVFDGSVVDFGRPSPKSKVYAPKYKGGRSDYTYGDSISEQGTVAAFKSGYPIIVSKQYGGVSIKCLVPQNASITDDKKFVMADFSPREAPVFQGENLIVLGDVVGDQKEEVFFKLIKLSPEDSGKYFTFCPSAKLTVSCRNPSSGKRETVAVIRYDYDIDETLSEEYPSSYIGYSSSSNTLGLRGALTSIPVPDDRQCTLATRFTVGTIPLYGATAEVLFQDRNGPYGQPCAVKKMDTMRTNLLGYTPPLELISKAEFSRYLSVAVQDPKFYTYGDLRIFQLDIGDGARASNLTCE